MSRTFRKDQLRTSRVWVNAQKPNGDLMPFKSRHKIRDGRKNLYVCGCDWCLRNKMHRNNKRFSLEEELKMNLPL